MKKKIILFLSLFLTSCLNTSDEVPYYEDKTFDAYSILEYGKFNDAYFLNSIGEQNILVVPILFSDCSLNNDEIIKMKDDIEVSFFSNNSNSYESVSSYYYKSSYGKLKISGEVLDPIYIDKTAEEIANLKYDDSIYNGIKDEYYHTSYYPINYAFNKIKDNIDITKYDKNNDGYIDSIWFIYGEETYAEYCYKKSILYDSNQYDLISNLLWNYTYFYYNNDEDISINTYAFGSYKSMLNKNDAHIFIHETGHMLGLSDYYNYNINKVDTTLNKIDHTMPLGGLDMMDLNIGDHNCYSKLLLNWINPKVVNSSFNYSLKTSSLYDDALLIPISKFNNSPFAKYLLIEYYTPKNLNEYDSIYHYKSNNSYPLMFQEKGIKIYLVDSRLGYKKNSNVYYIDDFSSINDLKYYNYVYSNTPTKSLYYSISPSEAYNNRLITLLSRTGKNTFYSYNNTYRFAKNTDLFKENDVFEYTFKEDKYKIKIVFLSFNDDSANLNIEVNKI